VEGRTEFDRPPARVGHQSGHLGLGRGVLGDPVGCVRCPPVVDRDRRARDLDEDAVRSGRPQPVGDTGDRRHPCRGRLVEHDGPVDGGGLHAVEADQPDRRHRIGRHRSQKGPQE
jgi:hypothetical protein